jgi:ribonuclease R
LCIHRIIKKVLNGGYEEAQKLYGDLVESIAKQCSEREKRATEAERDVDDLYKTMYMSERIGEEYEAVISGVTSFGIFAELKNSVEGFIPIESLFGYFKFDKDTFTLRSADETFTLGEKLLVEVVDVDFYRRRTQFRLLEKVENEPTVYEANENK